MNLGLIKGGNPVATIVEMAVSDMIHWWDEEVVSWNKDMFETKP